MTFHGSVPGTRVAELMDVLLDDPRVTAIGLHLEGLKNVPGFARAALSRFDGTATLDFFHALGLLTTAEPSGRVYPLSDQSNSVVDVLRFAAAPAGGGAKLRTMALVQPQLRLAPIRQHWERWLTEAGQ